MLNYLVIAATGVLGWWGFNWVWVLPLSLLAAVLALVFPPARLKNLIARDVLVRVFLGTLPIQAGLVVLFWLAGHWLRVLTG